LATKPKSLALIPTESAAALKVYFLPVLHIQFGNNYELKYFRKNINQNFNKCRNKNRADFLI